MAHLIYDRRDSANGLARSKIVMYLAGYTDADIMYGSENLV